MSNFRRKFPVPSDLDIAQAAKVKPIMEIAEKLGLEEEELIFYGRNKAKVHLDVLKRLEGSPKGKYVDVTAITPTPLGEGKTTTSVGLVPPEVNIVRFRTPKIPNRILSLFFNNSNQIQDIDRVADTKLIGPPIRWPVITQVRMKDKISRPGQIVCVTGRIGEGLIFGRLYVSMNKNGDWEF